ncbi:MAG TPA: two-component regulator propeller domain-containing protein, partial [Verrucomicrobiae bacterium]|nr:two-component regulator propeller domain-containing protein [Verrucomicrobiae bacterium]
LPPASGISVEGVQAADRGGLWVLLSNRLGTQLYHFQNGQWESTGEVMDSHPDHSFLAATSSGDLWLSVHYASVKRVRDGRFTTHQFTPDSASVVPQCAFEDREGNLWIGTEKTGIYRWHPRRITSFSSQDGLSHEKAWTICESPDGGVWIGTEGGLSRFRRGAFTNLTVDDGLPNRVVRALATDRQRRLWVGTLSGLACVADDQIIHYKFPGPWFSSKIRAILIDRHHRLWAGSASGLHRVALPDDSESQSGGIIDPQQSISFGTNSGLFHDDVSALLEDDSGRIWIGTSGGLNRMDGDRMEGFSHLPNLAHGNVGVLYQDDEGTIWIGAESGLHCFRDGTFTAFTTKEGLFDDLINSIVEDNQKRLWFGGDRGIYRVPKAEFDAGRAGRASRLRPVIYDDADGLPSRETNGQKCQPAAGRMKDGRLWFPTTKGVVVFDPERLPDNTNSPPVVIEQIRANGRIVNWGGASSTGSAIHLPAGTADVLEIHYTATTFIAPERVRFKYKLEGQDDDWVEADGRRAAYYTNLRPGRYLFHVIAANSHGLWNESGAAIGFYVAPHYHQTLAFRLACAFGGILLVGGIYRWRVGELRKIQSLQQQAALLDERARIARNLHDGLGANLTQLTLLADLAEQGHPDAIRERVRTLAVTSRETARALKDLLWATHPSDESLEGLIARICQDAQEFCAAAHIRCRFDLPGQLPEHVLAPAARQSLFLAAKEALNNVAKHARASEAIVRVRTNQNILILEIEDNGCGFDPENALPAAPTRGPRAQGRGLENLRSRAREAGGEFVLESRPGNGTKIRFNIPLAEVKE